MKKKRRLILLCTLGVTAVLLIALTASLANRGYGLSRGRYLEAQNGASLLILDNSPIRMSDIRDKDLFSGLDTGDEVLVFHDGIAESYPGQTGAYALFKLSDGTVEDIPKTVTDTLAELGWVD